MKKYAYIASAVSKIDSKKEKWEIEKELAAHIDELMDFYINNGMSEEDAEEKAVEEMGPPEPVSEELAKLHNINIRENMLMIFFSGVGISFLWARLNLMLSLSTYGSGILQQSVFYDPETEEIPLYNKNILIFLIIISLTNYLLLIMYYKFGKHIKCEIGAVSGTLLFLLPHIILMFMLDTFEWVTNDELAYQAVSWWTSALNGVFDFIYNPQAYHFTSNLYESVGFNIALTFIPYMASVAGMLKAKYRD